LYVVLALFINLTEVLFTAFCVDFHNKRANYMHEIRNNRDFIFDFQKGNALTYWHPLGYSTMCVALVHCR